jgi:hypothetical protein
MAIERRETPESGGAVGRRLAATPALELLWGPSHHQLGRRTHLAGSGPILFRQLPGTAFERWTAFRGTMPDATAA